MEHATRTLEGWRPAFSRAPDVLRPWPRRRIRRNNAEPHLRPCPTNPSVDLAVDRWASGRAVAQEVRAPMDPLWCWKEFAHPGRHGAQPRSTPGLGDPLLRTSDKTTALGLLRESERPSSCRGPVAAPSHAASLLGLPSKRPAAIGSEARREQSPDLAEGWHPKPYPVESRRAPTPGNLRPGGTGRPCGTQILTLSETARAPKRKRGSPGPDLEYPCKAEHRIRNPPPSLASPATGARSLGTGGVTAGSCSPDLPNSSGGAREGAPAVMARDLSPTRPSRSQCIKELRAGTLRNLRDRCWPPGRKKKPPLSGAPKGPGTK